MTHMCVGEWVNTGSDNGMLPVQHQTITYSNADSLTTLSDPLPIRMVRLPIYNV